MGRRILLGIVSSVLIGAATVGCASHPRVGESTPTAADPSQACRAATESPMDDCLRDVTRLNEVLSGRLKALLPQSAVVTNNLFDFAGPVGGPGLSFVLRHGENGDLYTASLRVRVGEDAFNLSVDVGRYASLPGDDRCAVDEETRLDRESKGIVTVECGDRLDDQGNTLFRAVTAEPYGTGEYAGILVPHALVELYRPDGILVQVALETVLEHAPAGEPSGDVRTLPLLLSPDELVVLAGTPELTLT